MTSTRSSFSALALLLLAGGLAACATVTAVKTLADGQTGRIGFETWTPADRQFLTGGKAGTTVVIWGELRLPRSEGGRLPAVILIHGSSGVGPNMPWWTRELNGIGVATFVLDSFTGRGITETATDQSRLSTGAMIVDAYRALELLATHPRIDPSRIAIMGFSKGGAVSLYASLTRFQRMYGPRGVEFAAYLPFYPPCNIALIDDERVSDRPIRIFHGTADDWTPIASCRAYAGRLRRAGKDVQVLEFPDAHHGFDVPSLPGMLFLTQVQNGSRCFFVEREVGWVVNRETGRPAGYDDPCISRGGTVGYHPRAHAEAVKAVKAILTDVFKLGQ